MTPQDGTERGWFWYGVRTVYRWPRQGAYEERVTIWRAQTADDAIAMADEEGDRYIAANRSKFEIQRLDNYANCYLLVREPTNGSEVYSLLRSSDMSPEEYVDRFFETGAEWGDANPEL